MRPILQSGMGDWCEHDLPLGERSTRQGVAIQESPSSWGMGLGTDASLSVGLQGAE